MFEAQLKTVYFNFKDFFNVMLYQYEVFTMEDDFVYATPENKANAIRFVNYFWTIIGSYGNDFKLAYSTAFDLFDPYTAEDIGIFSSLMFFLLI